MSKQYRTCSMKSRFNMRPKETMVREMADGRAFRIVAINLHTDMVKVVRLSDGMPLTKTTAELGLRLTA